MIKRLFSSQLRTNMVSGVATTAINVVVLVIAYPVYLHFLGYERYGVWLILATVLTFTQLSDLGISSAVIKLVAEEHGRGNTKGIQSYVTTSLGILLVTGSLALTLILLFQNQIISAFKLSGQNAVITSQLLPYIAFLSVCVMLVQVLNAAISGLGRMDLANYIVSGGRVVTMGTSLILLWLGNDIESLLIGNTLSCIFIGGASIFCIRKMVDIRLLRLGNLNKKYYNRLLRFGGGVFGGSLISMLGRPFHRLMLARYGSLLLIPIYDITFNASFQIRNIIETGFRALTPEVSKVYIGNVAEAKSRIIRINRLALKLIFMVALPLYALLLYFSEPLMRIWLGSNFVQSIPTPFRIFLAATFVNMFIVPAYHILLGIGRVRQVFISRCITWFSNMIIIVVLILCFHKLTPSKIASGLIFSWFLSACYLNWELHRAISKITENNKVQVDSLANTITKEQI